MFSGLESPQPAPKPSGTPSSLWVTGRTQRCAAERFTTGKEEGAQFVMFADFLGVNTPTMADKSNYGHRIPQLSPSAPIGWRRPVPAVGDVRVLYLGKLKGEVAAAAWGHPF